MTILFFKYCTVFFGGDPERPLRDITVVFLIDCRAIKDWNALGFNNKNINIFEEMICIVIASM